MDKDGIENQRVYEEYAIEGWPCHFFRVESADKYNEKLKKYCKQLKKDAKDLTSFQKLKLVLYSSYLDVQEVVVLIFEKFTHDKSK